MNTVTPDDVGLSSERLDRITKWMEDDVASGRIAGAVAAVSRGGKLAYVEARGMADNEAQTPMKEDAIFRIYSMSKPITSVALMMLYEEGRFKLKEPVSKYIPELGGLHVLVEDLHPNDYGMDGLSKNSAGDVAPIFRPTGPCMRSSSTSERPDSRSRSSRCAWVRRLPSAPM